MGADKGLAGVQLPRQRGSAARSLGDRLRLGGYPAEYVRACETAYCSSLLLGRAVRRGQV